MKWPRTARDRGLYTNLIGEREERERSSVEEQRKV